MTEKFLTQVDNSLIGYLMKIQRASQIKILLCIVRFTKGFHREKTELSAGFIAKYTGLSRRTVVRELSELEKTGIIIRKSGSENCIKTVCINSDVCDSGDVAPDTGGSDICNTAVYDKRDRGDSDAVVTQEINNINKYISNKESKETLAECNFSKTLLKAVNDWAEIHNLNKRSYDVLFGIIRKYASDFGDEAVADIINQCIAEGRGSIYFDRLGKVNKRFDNPDIEAFTWESLSM